jgi:tryptophan synthase beta chain
LAAQKRVRYEAVTDKEALDALALLAKEEGIIPAIESAHALAKAFQMAQTMTPNQSVLVCLSGRGDKDMHTLQRVYKEGYDE